MITTKIANEFFIHIFNILNDFVNLVKSRHQRINIYIPKFIKWYSSLSMVQPISNITWILCSDYFINQFFFLYFLILFHIYLHIYKMFLAEKHVIELDFMNDFNWSAYCELNANSRLEKPMS